MQSKSQEPEGGSSRFTNSSTSWSLRIWAVSFQFYMVHVSFKTLTTASTVPFSWPPTRGNQHPVKATTGPGTAHTQSRDSPSALVHLRNPGPQCGFNRHTPVACSVTLQANILQQHLTDGFKHNPESTRDTCCVLGIYARHACYPKEINIKLLPKGKRTLKTGAQGYRLQLISPAITVPSEWTCGTHFSENPRFT